MPETSEEHDFEKHDRKRHLKRWKGDAQRVASKLSHAIKTHHHGGDNMKHSSENESPSLPESSSFTELDSLPNSDLSTSDSDFSFQITPPTQAIPPPLSGGLVVDTKYAVGATELNSIIFKPGSAFTRDLLRAQKMEDYVEEPWKKTLSNGGMKRSISYTRAATKLVKALRAFESQTYLVAGEEGFCVLLESSTPDAPCGGSFVVEMQVVILALPELPNGDESCHLQVSWQVKFLHSTMMKGMIEIGAQNGIRETYAVYKEVLSHHAPPLSLRSAHSPQYCDDEKLISDWEIAWDYFKKWDVFLALMCLSFIIWHIALAPPKPNSGLEFWIISFPDSLMELVMSAVVVVQVERVIIMVFNFIQSYYLQSADHGVKAQGGDGWIVKVSLLEGANIAHCSSGTPSPYVVFTCNQKQRTSSVSLGTTNPTWQEVFEFNPMENPPSTMEVQVFHYEGPFSEAESLGHGEINFLKQSPGQLADFWLPLQTKDANTNGAELHLCVCLANAREGDILPEYLEHIEREVGLKIRKRSAHKNGSFQKLFSLPAEEFLMNDFACAIKRKILIQGRLYVSPRLLGFYSNLFGHKTKFILLWEDIEEIKESVAQSINPSITVFTRKGCGFDARHGARGVDAKGRLKFQFLSFVRSGSAFRAIVALWKNISLRDQKMDVLASLEAGDMKYSVAERQADDFREELEASMSEVLHMQIPITVEAVNKVIEDDKKERFLNEKLGLSNYESSRWEVVDGIQRRHRSYRVERSPTSFSEFGSTISSIQHKTMSLDSNKMVIDDNFTLDDVPFGDHFQIQVRMELETLSMQPITTQYKAFVGVVWHRATEFDQRKVTKSIYEHMTNQLRCLVQLIVEEARG